MSLETEDKHEKFRRWKEEIELRCEEYVAEQIFNLPEGHLDLELAVHRLANLTTALALNKRVEVRESQYTCGIWVVVVGNEVRKIFTGEDAHQKATFYAGELLDGKWGPL